MRLAPLLAILTLVACNKTDKPSPDPSTTTASASAVTTTKAPPPVPKAPPPLDQMRAKESLPDAIGFAKTYMEDTRNKTDNGSLLLADWAARKGLKWAAIQALPETSIAKVMKDSDEERGKRICASGTMIEIATDKSDGVKTYRGGLSTNDNGTITFIAVGSTGELVERSPARFCGVVTGKNSYSNSGGGTTHSVRAVGMFDLPENKKTTP